MTAADLAPVFGTLGPEGVVPRQLVIELARPIAPEGSEEAAKAEGTRLSLHPKLDGELRRTGPSTLVFEPTEPFAPATTYTATLAAVRTSDGKELRAPGGGWTYRFTTPGFALSRMSLVASGGDGQKKDRYGTATVDLVFTAPVELESVRGRASFTVTDSFGRDAPVAGWGAQQQAPNTVRISLRSDAMRPNRRLRLTLAAGAEQDRGTGIAPAARDEVTLPKGGDAVEVKAIFPAEATSGYYVEIVCNDEAAEGEEEAGGARPPLVLGPRHPARLRPALAALRVLRRRARRQAARHAGGHLHHRARRRRHAPLRRLQARPLLDSASRPAPAPSTAACCRATTRTPSRCRRASRR